MGDKALDEEAGLKGSVFFGAKHTPLPLTAGQEQGQ